MALRVLRLAAVASILAFGLTARAITPTYAHAGRQAASPSVAIAVAPPTDLSEPLPTDPPLTDPPPSSDPPPLTDPSPSDPPALTAPPPSDSPPPVTVGPAATDPPPTAAPTDPTVSPEPSPPALDTAPPSDPATPAAIDTPAPVPTQAIGAPASTDPPAAEPPVVVAPPTEPPVAAEPAPTATDAPSVDEPPVPAPFDTQVPEPTPTFGEPGLTDPSLGEQIPLLPVAVPLPIGVSPAPAHNVASEAARAGAAQPAHETVAISPARPVKAPPLVAPDWVPHMTGLTLPEQLEPVAAGIVAGLAVTNRAPASVAVAIEFGRVGGGWASAIVFNLWLSRQMRMRRMSQRQLAALSGVDHSTISRLLLHDRRPSLATATKLARALRQVEGESDTADYFERIPEETVFPSRRVEMALRADELLDDEEVRRLMSLYLDARRRRQAAMASNGRWSNGPPATPARAVQTGGAPDSRR